MPTDSAIVVAPEQIWMVLKKNFRKCFSERIEKGTRRNLTARCITRQSRASNGLYEKISKSFRKELTAP